MKRIAVRDITIANFFIKFSANAESRHEDQRGAMTGVACDDLCVPGMGVK